MFSIAVVDDHPLLVEGIAALMVRKGGFSIAETGSCAADIEAIALRLQPDAMIVDLNMPGEVFGAIKRVVDAAPGVKIIVFTASTSADDAVRALDSGASAYVLKGSPAQEVIEAIASATRGEIYITPSFSTRVIGALQNRTRERREESARLTVREDQIVRLLLCGKQNREIAIALSLSEKTVKGYMSNLMQKLNARNRLEVVIAAQRLSLAPGTQTPAPQPAPVRDLVAS
ncbi:DNA-binding response regulator [Alsobacter metallidurans]|uniref:DNA-binding response regulator n=1 Tax=Alsobacter metallidurans TaxID=340221 RepID=A0A917MHA5_9HYPH|nr:response regulator transcription factor [Alsobacter metallidurans]GGH19462.1 DNA-binding response regulator [Alsobacter metallidurans]